MLENISQVIKRILLAAKTASVDTICELLLCNCAALAQHHTQQDVCCLPEGVSEIVSVTSAQMLLKNPT